MLSDAEKATLAEIAHRLQRKALEELAAVAKPDTLLAWYRKLIANKFDGSKFRKSWGRPRVDEETERWVVQGIRCCRVAQLVALRISVVPIFVFTIGPYSCSLFPSGVAIATPASTCSGSVKPL